MIRIPWLIWMPCRPRRTALRPGGLLRGRAITVLAALPPKELAKVSEVSPLTGPERDLVASWSAPDSWQPGSRHPGRGKYLLKTGGRLGIPVEMSLVEQERPCTTQTRRYARPR